MTTTTKKMILDRVNRQTATTVVPERAIKLIDKIMEDHAVEAGRKWPSDYWARVEFFKQKVLDSVMPQFRGMMAVAFHEYTACLLRGEDAEIESDAEFFGGFDDRPYNPYAEGVAQRDAYMACIASLS
jgi:hypothetical protein